MLDSNQILEIIRAMGEKICANKEYLTELDQPIGDSDHGINMARGFTAVEAKLPTLTDKDPGTILKTVGMTLVSTVGGASGPLYGTAFMRAGAAVGEKKELDIHDLIAILDAAVEGVKMRGHATVGEATMLDAMVPALNAIRAAADGGRSPKEALDAGVQAAWAGAEYTKGLVATKGRASYVGERGIGHQDPGATSFSYLLETVAKAVA